MSGLDDLSGRVAVITGGASGIGLGMARQMRGQGMDVVIADIEEGPLAQAAQDIDAVPIQTDVSDPDSVAHLAEAVMDRFGKVDVVCNNAGVGSIAAISDMTIDDWRWIIGVNLFGVIHGVSAFLPLLKANENGGHIVNTSSLGGLGTMPLMGGYSVTKFGVVALSETLAQELAAEESKVGVTVLCPGSVRTNIKNSMRNRPGALADGKLADSDLEGSEVGKLLRWATPEEVGDIVIRAIKRGDLYCFTHPDMGQSIIDRGQAIADALEQAHEELGV